MKHFLQEIKNTDQYQCSSMTISGKKTIMKLLFKKKLLAIAISAIGTISSFYSMTSLAASSIQYSEHNDQWFANIAGNASTSQAILTSDNGLYFLYFSQGYLGIYDFLGHVIWGVNMQDKASYFGMTKDGLGLWEGSKTSAVFLSKPSSSTTPTSQVPTTKLVLTNDGNLLYQTMQNNNWVTTWQTNTTMPSNVTTTLSQIQTQKNQYNSLVTTSNTAKYNLSNAQQDLNSATARNNDAVNADVTQQKDTLAKIRAHNHILTSNAFEIASAGLKRVSGLPSSSGATLSPPTVTSTPAGSNTKHSANYKPPLPQAQQNAVNCVPAVGVGTQTSTATTSGNQAASGGANASVSAGVGGSASATVTSTSIDTEVSFRDCVDAVVSVQGQLNGPGGSTLGASVTLETFAGSMMDANLQANQNGLQASVSSQDGVFITMTTDASANVQGFGVDANGQVVVMSGSQGSANLQANKNGVAAGAEGTYGSGVNASGSVTQNMRYGSTTTGAGASVGVVGAGGSVGATTSHGVLNLELTGDLAAGVGLDLDLGVGVNYGQSYNDLRSAYNALKQTRQAKHAAQQTVLAAQTTYNTMKATADKAQQELTTAADSIAHATSQATTLVTSEVSKDAQNFAKVTTTAFENPSAIAAAAAEAAAKAAADAQAAADAAAKAAADAANKAASSVSSTAKSVGKSIKHAFHF